MSKSNLTKAFAALRKAGYFARQNFMCCQSCAWAAIPVAKEDKAVFYHSQDNQSVIRGQKFHLGWAGDQREICRILEENGVKTNGAPKDSSMRIEVIEW
jgi:hypothetical protein